MGGCALLRDRDGWTLWSLVRQPTTCPATTLSGPPVRPAGDVVNAVPRGVLRQPPYHSAERNP